VKPQLEEEGRERMRAAAKKGGVESGKSRRGGSKACANLHNPSDSESTTDPASSLGPARHDSTEQAAEMFNVSRRIVADASKVLAESPTDAAKVESGEMTVHAARTKGRPPNGHPQRKAEDTRPRVPHRRVSPMPTPFTM
jgi:hypothetical protein